MSGDQIERYPNFESMQAASIEPLYHYGLDEDGKSRKIFINENDFNKMSKEERKGIVIIYAPRPLTSSQSSWIPSWW